MTIQFNELQRHLETLDQALARIRPLASSRLPTDPVSRLSDPSWRSLSSISGLHLVLLAQLEPVLADLSQKKTGPFVDEWIESMASKPPDYWTSGAISRGVLDVATERCIITALDRETLLRTHNWDKASFDVQAIVDDLTAHTAFLRDLMRRLESEASKLKTA